MRDPDRMIRGVGAIAAQDAGNGKRLRARNARARLEARRDARHANLTLGVISQLGTPMQSQPTLKTGGSIDVPPYPSFTTPVVTTTPPTTTYYPPPVNPLPPFTQPPPNGGPRPMFTSSTPFSIGPPRPTVGTNGGGGGGGTVEPAIHPGLTPPTTPPRADPVVVTGGGGGGGGGGFTFPPPQVLPEWGAPPTVEELPDSPGSSSTKNLLLVGAGIGLLYLLFKD